MSLPYLHLLPSLFLSPSRNHSTRDRPLTPRSPYLCSDHVNDYCALAKSPEDKPQLWMCYAGGSGFGGYAGYGGYHRRVRVFEIDTNEARISTYKRLEYGDTERKVDEQIIVEVGRIVAG